MKKLVRNKVMKYLSFTSFNMLDKDPEQFYLQYIKGMPRFPQTKPMAIGSAFDSRVKQFLVPSFDAAQYIKGIDKNHRDEVMSDSDQLINVYNESGSLQQLKDMIGISECWVEESIEKDITFNGRTVRIMGKPDLHFRLQDGTVIILDWKVNGFYSQASPSPGYVNIWDKEWKGPHKDVVETKHNDINLNMVGIHKLDWRQQLMMYSWLIGNEVGGKAIGIIDQMACNSRKDPSQIRVAQHRAYLPKDEQIELFNDLCDAWERIHSENFLCDLEHLYEKDGDVFI